MNKIVQMIGININSKLGFFQVIIRDDQGPALCHHLLHGFAKLKKCTFFRARPTTCQEKEKYDLHE